MQTERAESAQDAEPSRTPAASATRKGPKSPEGDAHFLRWRMRERIRRFFRPTLRRPLPRRRAPMRFPQSSSHTFHPDGRLRKPPGRQPHGAPNPLVPGKKTEPEALRPADSSLRPCFPPGVVEVHPRLPPRSVEVRVGLSPGVVEVRVGLSRSRGGSRWPLQESWRFALASLQESWRFALAFLRESWRFALVSPGVVEVRVGLPPGALRIGSTTVPRQPTPAPSATGPVVRLAA
jgi:hypothetical protein